MNARRWFFAILLVGLALGYLATGIVVVQLNERVVVRRLGRRLPRELGPGLHLELPWGLARWDRLRPEETRQITIGLRPDEDVDVLEMAESAGLPIGQYLTGDHNLVHLGLNIQYSMSAPAEFLFAARDTDTMISAIAEALLTEVVAGTPIDDILVGAEVVFVERIGTRLQKELDNKFHLGITIRRVNFTVVAPPPAVADAFADVARAKSQREQRIHEARTYQVRAEQQGLARAREVLDRAEGASDRLRVQAKAEADRFANRLAAYRLSVQPDLERQRLLLETLEMVLPRLGKILVQPDDDAPLDLSIYRANN